MNLKNFQEHLASLPTDSVQAKEENISNTERKIRALCKVVAVTSPALDPEKHQDSIQAVEDLLTSLKEGTVLSFTLFGVIKINEDQHRVLNVINALPPAALAAGLAIEEGLGKPLKEFKDDN